MRTRSPSIDQNSPAHKVMAQFGGLTEFSIALGCPVTTAHRWLKNGLIPADRQADVILAGREKGFEIDPADFVPVPDEAPARAA